MLGLLLFDMLGDDDVDTVGTVLGSLLVAMSCNDRAVVSTKVRSVLLLMLGPGDATTIWDSLGSALDSVLGLSFVLMLGEIDKIAV